MALIEWIFKKLKCFGKVFLNYFIGMHQSSVQVWIIRKFKVKQKSNMRIYSSHRTRVNAKLVGK